MFFRFLVEILIPGGIGLFLVWFFGFQIMAPLFKGKAILPYFNPKKRKLIEDKGDLEDELEMAELRKKQLASRRKLRKITTDIDKEETEEFKVLAEGIQEIPMLTHKISRNAEKAEKGEK